MASFLVFVDGDSDTEHYEEDMHSAKEFAKVKAFENPTRRVVVYERIAVFTGNINVVETKE